MMFSRLITLIYMIVFDSLSQYNANTVVSAFYTPPNLLCNAFHKKPGERKKQE